MNIINPYRHAGAYHPLPTGNITHQYDFDGDSTDAVGSKDGTDTNMTYGAGVGDNLAAIFDGTAYILLPSDMSGAVAEFTYSCLIQGNTTTTQYRFWTFDYPNDGWVMFSLNAATSRIQVAVRRDNSTTIVLNSDSYTTTDWHHVCVTIDRDGAVILYIDGTEIGNDTISPSSNLGNLGTSTNVFGSARNFTLKLNGKMAACKVWDVILNSDEVGSLATQELAGIKVN